MRYRALGRTGLKVSEIGYGAWGLGGIQWLGGSRQESLSSLRRAFELGINFVDTALAYGDGHSERLIGEALRQWANPVVVATKIPPKNMIWPASSSASWNDVFPLRHVLDSTDASLRNLAIETIGLQQLHVWNPRWTAQEDWRRTFEELKRSGKVQYLGVSLTEHDSDSGVPLAESGLVDCLQVIYNIFDPAAADKLFPVAKRHAVAILARVPLDEGGLTGQVREDTVFQEGDFRARYFRGDRKKLVAERVRKLQADLADFEGDLPEIAIRFCLSHSAVTAVIPGMRHVQHVERNAEACKAGPLPPVVLEVLRNHRWNRNFYE